MKNNYLKASCLIAVFYFAGAATAQKRDSTMKEKKIDEVVVIGYGSQKKVNVTGSVSNISGAQIANQPNANPVSSIQGKVAGVQIVNAGGPGGSPRVDIRGVSTLSGGTVFIVDGILTEDISFLNPSDVESMSILKDPSSLAIYGSKAAKGAVIITTKSGKGKTVFNFNSYAGVKVLTNVPKMANTAQYIEMYNEKLKNEGVSDPAKFLSKTNFPADTNWFKDIFGTGLINSTDLSASGKWKGLSYYVSGGYIQDDGVLRAGRGVNSGNDFKRITGRANLSYKINPNITVGANTSISHINTNNTKNPTLAALISPPLYFPINPEGTYGYQSMVSVANPRAELDLFRSKNAQDRLLFNPWAEIKFLKDFTFKISYSKENIDFNMKEYSPVINYNPASNTRASLVQKDTKNRNYVWDNILTWKKRLNRHNIELLAGYSRQEESYSGLYQKGLDPVFDGDYKNLDITKTVEYFSRINDPAVDMVPYKNRIESIFGRLNYDYDGRYLLNASIRRDGSSRFSPESRYHIFPAVSAGWVVSKEAFMQNQDIFSLLKLRASWGRLGNPDVPRAYDALTTVITSGTYYGGIGYPAQTVAEIVDPTINWEVTTGRDFGLEMGFLKNDLKIEATYFDKDSKDVVYSIVQLSTSGASNANSYQTNAFSFNNKGFELGLNYDHRVNSDFKFGLYANGTTLKNEITSVYGNSYQEPGTHLFGQTLIRLEKGVPVGSFYGYKVDGIFQNAAEVAAAPVQNGKTVGGFKFADLNGDGQITEADKTFLGSPIPKFTYGLGFNLNYKAIDFAMDFQGVSGNKIYNYNRNQRYGNENWDLDFYNNRWHGAGTSNTYPMVTNSQDIIKPNSFYVEDGSFFRIRNIQVGYTVPGTVLQSAGIEKFRLYFSAQNPWTSFKYKGFSPEILNTDRVQMGVDNNIYPLSAIYTMGVNVTF